MRRYCTFVLAYLVIVASCLDVSTLLAIGCDEDCKEADYWGLWSDVNPEEKPDGGPCWEMGIEVPQMGYMARPQCKTPVTVGSKVLVPATTGMPGKVCVISSMTAVYRRYTNCTPGCVPAKAILGTSWLEVTPGMEAMPRLELGMKEFRACVDPPSS